MEKAPQGTVVNSVGAGDSMVAGFLAGVMNTQSTNTERTKEFDTKHALRMGICAGSSSAFHAELATKEEIQTLYASLYTVEGE